MTHVTSSRTRASPPKNLVVPWSLVSSPKELKALRAAAAPGLSDRQLSLDTKVAFRCWRALRTCLLLAVPKLAGLIRGIGPHRRAWESLMRLRKKLCFLFVHRGSVSVAAYLKEVSHRCRMASLGLPVTLPFKGALLSFILDLGTSSAAVLAGLGRALPVPPKSVVQRALREHTAVLTSQPPDPPSDEDAGRFRVALITYLRQHAKRVVNAGDDWATPLPAATAASVDYGRQRGGMRRSARSDYPTSSYSLKASGGQSAVRYLQDNTLILNDDIGRARQAALPERGFKARVVTALSHEEVAAADHLRKRFWFLLNDDFVVLDDDSDFHRNLRRRPGERIVSTDLSKATDYAPFWSGMAVWNCIHEVFGLSSSTLMLVERLLGPHRMMTESGSEVVTSRGWLMGSPITWLTLSLSHLAIGLASNLTRRQLRIKGDDALIIASRKSINSYFDLMNKFGYVINHTKTFSALKAGIFVERVIRVGPHSSSVVIPIPTKAIAEPSLENLAEIYKFHEVGTSKLRPRSIVRDLTVSSSRQIVDSLLKASWRTKSVVRQFLHLPRALGGLALPHQSRLSGSLRSRTGQLLLRYPSLVPRAFARSEERALDVVVSFFRLKTRERWLRGGLGDWVPVTSPHTLAPLASAYVTFAAKLSEPDAVRISDVVRAWTRSWRKLRKLDLSKKSPRAYYEWQGEGSKENWTFGELAYFVQRAALSGIYVPIDRRSWSTGEITTPVRYAHETILGR